MVNLTSAARLLIAKVKFPFAIVERAVCNMCYGNLRGAVTKGTDFMNIAKHNNAFSVKILHSAYKVNDYRLTVLYRTCYNYVMCKAQ